jgi:KDO2-lipid IV(A) lauroyltransferase
MITVLFRFGARVPLAWLHGLGVLAGWAVYLAAPRYRRLLRENLAASGVCADAAAFRRTLCQAVAEAGKSVLELPAIWFRPQGEVARLVRECVGCEHIEAAHTAGKGILFLTPHMGCFEITSLFYAERHPITILYRPPKLSALQPLLEAGRARGKAALAPADLAGVKALLRALKRGEAAGILPDQVPGRGEGVWAPFFGRPAYTMTLPARLAQATGASVLMAFGERLAKGRGYRLWIAPVEVDWARPAEETATCLNREIEALVRRNPAQYLWSYNRYKTPKGAEAPAC